MKRYKYILLFISIFGLSMQNDVHKTHFLAPKTMLKAKNTVSLDAQYQEFLKNKCFAPKEKAFIENLEELTTYLQKNPDATDLKERRNTFARLMTDALLLSSTHLNLSLFGIIEEYYLKTLDDPNIPNTHTDYLKRILYSLGTEGTSLYDPDAKQTDEKEIYRQTEPGRLAVLDKIILQNPSTLTNEIVFYDMGASYGSTTLDTYDLLKAKFPEADVNVFPSDLNMEHHILYDLKDNKRIYFNGLGQIKAIYDLNLEKEVPLNFNKANILNKYTPVLKKLKSQLAKKDSFAGDSNYVLEKVVLVDPRLKTKKGIEPLQHDIKHQIDKNMPKANVIRVANLLQYFTSLSVKAGILNNLLNNLKEGGMILFNFGQVTEDSKYLFALRRTGKHVEIMQIEHNIANNFLAKLFRNKANYRDLRDLKQILDSLGYTYSETEHFQSPASISRAVQSAA